MDIFSNFSAPRNGIVHCTCGWSYATADEEDQRNHSEHHAEFRRVTEAKKHVPWPFVVRERMKDCGREALRTAITDVEVLAASELMVRAWFDRSFARAIELGFGDDHPNLDEYTRMLSDEELLAGRAGEVLRSVFRHVPRPGGVLDSSLWERR